MAGLKSLARPRVLIWVHGIKTLVYAALIPVSLLTDLKSSIAFVVFLSLEALVESSWAAWQGARAEASNGD